MKTTLYALIDTSEDITTNLITITSTKDQAKAYARSYLRSENIFHFKRWCELRKLDYTDEDAWTQYMLNCITEERLNRFRVTKLSFSKNDIAETFRICMNCTPLGLDYEGDGEYSKFAQIIAQSSDDKEFIENLKETVAFDPKLDYILTNLNLK